MKLKYYLRGLGAGIVLATVSLSLILGKQTNTELTDEQIIERAEALGMEMKKASVHVDYNAINQSINGTKDEAQTNGTNDETGSNDESKEAAANDESSDAESNDAQSNDVNKNDESDDATNGSSNKVDNNKDGENANETSAENITGSGSADKEQDKELQSQETDSSDETSKETVSDDQKSGETEREDSESNSNATGEIIINEQPVTKTITIRPGMTATQVCQLLEDQGVISSAEDFNLYLIDHRLTANIISKKIDIAVNTEFKKIAEMITE